MRKPNKVMVREWVEVESPHTYTRGDLEHLQRNLDDLLADHSGWRTVSVFINAEYEDRCPHCNESWEPDYTRKLKPCGYCGKSLL